MLYPQKKTPADIKFYTLNRKAVPLDTTTIIPNITLLPVGWSKNRPNDRVADE